MLLLPSTASRRAPRCLLRRSQQLPRSGLQAAMGSRARRRHRGRLSSPLSLCITHRHMSDGPKRAMRPDGHPPRGDDPASNPPRVGRPGNHPPLGGGPAATPLGGAAAARRLRVVPTADGPSTPPYSTPLHSNPPRYTASCTPAAPSLSSPPPCRYCTSMSGKT